MAEDVDPFQRLQGGVQALIQVQNYLRLGFVKGGRDRPLVDCWGLYRLIVGESLDIWLAEFEGHEAPMRIARTAAREASSSGWLPVVPGDERPFDCVLMTGLLGEGRGTLSAPIHVGCVVDVGRLIDIEEIGGVRVRAFRTTSTARASSEVANRIRGIFRPRALA